jgi:hypothetical protein
MRLAAVLAAAVLAAARPVAGDTISEPTALLQGLDKTTARVSEFEAPIGKPVRFGDLSIVVRDCERNTPEERPENAAFLEIYELRPDEQQVRLFSGWMFSSSPALSTLEHPIYDVNVLECKGAALLAEPPPSPPNTPR